MVLVVFGIIAVHQFGGKTSSCNDGNVMDRAFCIGWWVSQDDGVLRQRVWSQPFSNFDNLGAVGIFYFWASISVCCLVVMIKILLLSNLAHKKLYAPTMSLEEEVWLKGLAWWHSRSSPVAHQWNWRCAMLMALGSLMSKLHTWPFFCLAQFDIDCSLDKRAEPRGNVHRPFWHCLGWLH